MSNQNLKIQSESNQIFNIRQDRTESDPERIKLKIEKDKVISVINYSSFGLAVESNNKLNEEYLEASFLVDDANISILAIKKVREIKVFDNKYQTAFTVVGNPLDVDAVEAIIGLNNILIKRDELQNKNLNLNIHFRLIVLEIKDILIKLQADILAIEKNSFEIDKIMLENYEEKISNRVSEYLSKLLAPKYAEIEVFLKDIPKTHLSQYLEYFRENVGELMLQSAYASRAFFKPKGYAGDYEMMNHVYNRELRGKTLFAKCLQRYFVDEPAGKAVRNREQYLRKNIHKCINARGNKPIKILSVASGPAIEIQNFIKESNSDLSDIEFHLLDQDIDALKFAQRKIESACREKNIKLHTKLINKSIKTIIAEGLEDGNYNLIYSAGLFDYFTDPVANFAAKQLVSGLGNGGNLIIGNFSLNNPNQFAMGLIMDWNLIYRSPEQMEKLFKSLGTHYVLEQEEQSINLFSVITR
jgi:hypothetical protein